MVEKYCANCKKVLKLSLFYAENHDDCRKEAKNLPKVTPSPPPMHPIMLDGKWAREFS